MRKFKIATSIFVVFAIIGIFVVEVFAATYITFKLDGNFSFYATELGATFWGGVAVGDNHASAAAMSFDEGYLYQENAQTGNVYQLSGEESNYIDIQGTLGNVSIGGGPAYVYLFLKNAGDRSLVPNLEISYDTTKFTVTSQQVYFDVQSASSIDPLAIKANYSTLSSYLAAIKTNLTKSQAFVTNMSLEAKDVFVHIYKFVPKTGEYIESNGGFEITVNFHADIDYNSNEILTVYQDLNNITGDWKKYGYNNTLTAVATKIQSTSMTDLASKLTSAGTGNVVSSSDSYFNAPVYRKIDLVNIDIATGEPIGRLSDPSYTFEWFGGKVFMAAGTVLASGRTVGSSGEWFTVDVYTYYPTYYIRRWIAGEKEWLSVSEKEFAGSVEIPECYIASFESTIFQPKYSGNNLKYNYYDSNYKYVKSGTTVVEGTSKTYTSGGTTYQGTICYEVAYNSYGIIPRSYSYDFSPIATYIADWQMTNYLFQNNSGKDPTENVRQSTGLAWMKNLTDAWKSNLTSNPTKYNNSMENKLPMASHCQGENYVVFGYQWLYTIKYGDSDSQAQVGYGNINTNSYYNKSGVSVKLPNGTVTYAGSDSFSRLESQKGGDTIGFATSSTVNNTYKRSNNDLSYGYEYTPYVATTDNRMGKPGMYMHNFLTYTIELEDGSKKRVLLDGYVGTNWGTSVACLGKFNPWGNLWTRVYGAAVSGTSNSSGGVDIKLFITFDNYNYSSPNWYTSKTHATAATLSSGNYNYVQLTYLLPKSNSGATRLGISNVTSGNGKQSLIGVQALEFVTGTSQESGNLLGGDAINISTNTNYLNSTYGLMTGGQSSSTTSAGVYYYDANCTVEDASATFSIRTMLV